jgi:hypothetical protein
MNDLKVCWWPIDKPIPYARNSRKIPERAIDKVAASILRRTRDLQQLGSLTTARLCHEE